ncbi:hypothetical protein L218DRAFT_938615 [Marasmius fiardii PR-910]|nr:hypothetical protein L218DRAFT_938615 [Marasmius fiardii PR-910]
MRRTQNEDYEALSTEDVDGGSGYPQQTQTETSSRNYFFPPKSPVSILVILLCLSNLLFISLWIQARRDATYPDAQILYTPVKDILAYEPYTFYTGEILNVAPDIYSRPPSREVDEAWEQLYNDVGISAIDEKIAEQLPNRTAMIPGSKGKYRITLDVFHQLHCLNKIRQALHPDHYPANEIKPGHITHCINSIRQSLQCSSDVSTVVFQEKISTSAASDDSHMEPRFDIVHSCRNFGKIQEWAKAHREV